MSSRSDQPPAVPDPVRSAAVVAKLYVLAALDDAILRLVQVRIRYVSDLSGEEPFALLLAADDQVRARPGFDQRDGGAYVEALRQVRTRRRGPV